MICEEMCKVQTRKRRHAGAGMDGQGKEASVSSPGGVGHGLADPLNPWNYSLWADQGGLRSFRRFVPKSIARVTVRFRTYRTSAATHI